MRVEIDDADALARIGLGETRVAGEGCLVPATEHDDALMPAQRAGNAVGERRLPQLEVIAFDDHRAEIAEAALPYPCSVRRRHVGERTAQRGGTL